MMLASSAPSLLQQSPVVGGPPPAPPPVTTTSSSQVTANVKEEVCASSSTSPTSSDASMDMLTSLMNANVAAVAAAAGAPPNVANIVAPSSVTQQQESPPLTTPPLFTPDAVTLLQFSQLFQAQQAVAQFQAQAQQRQQQLQQQVQQHQQHQQHQQNQQQQQQQSQERKRSYPCTFQFCVICQKDVHSSKLPCHIRQCHVAKPMFQCPACDFTSTYSKNNVKSHMVSLHGLAGDPISYMDKYAGQVEEYMKLCFPNVRGRGRPMQGRVSPKSPVSPSQAIGRRASQASMMAAAVAVRGRTSSVVSQNDLLATLAAQQQVQQQQTHQQQAQGAFNPLRNLRFNPLQSIFPTVISNNNNNNSILGTKHSNSKFNNFLGKLKEKEQIAPSILTMVGDDSAKNPHALMNLSPPSCSSATVRLQVIKPGENAQPKYIDNNIDWCVLNDLQTKDTIFADCRVNMEMYIENITRKIDVTSVFSFNLSPDLRRFIENVRSRISIQLFEVMFAIHRMDIKVLDLELVGLLLKIAPTNCDAQILRKIETFADQNEEFLFGLTKIDHIEEKLETMKHMHLFDLQITSLGERISSFDKASKMVQESKVLRNLVQLVLAILNIGLFEDRNCLSINGFSISQIDEILNTRILNGQKVQSILGRIVKDEINVDLEEVISLIESIEKVENDDFVSIYETLKELEDKTMRAAREMEHSGTNVPLNEFVEKSKQGLVNALEWIRNVEQTVQKTTAFLCTTIPRQESHHDPRPTFQNVLHFLRTVKSLVEDCSSSNNTESDDHHINILSP